jgi:Flp pilus assembly pilin Flp
MLALYTRIRNRFDEESGQAAVEYAIMILLVALVLIAASPTIGTQIATFLSAVGDKLVVK